MRISDWSSDVCSSDLPGVAICPIWQGRAGKASASLPEPFQASRQIGDEVGGVFYADVQTDEWPLGFPGLCGTVILRIDRQSEAFISDRKSVVSGKSVSVRVDLGGRRVIKKKKKKK